MANSNIEIEITANLKDNATDKAKAVNKELDKLEKRNVNVDITATDKASKVMESIDSKLSKVDGSKTTTEIDKVVNKANSAVDGVAQVKLTADTSNVDKAIDSVKKKANDIKMSEIKFGKESSSQIYKQASANLDKWYNSASYADEHGIDRESMGFNELISYVEAYKEEAEELDYLKNAAKGYGLKYSKNANLESMRNLVWGYEDKNYNGNATAKNVDKNTKAIEKTTQKLDKYTGDSNQTIGSIKAFGKSMATRYLGVQSVYSGATEAFGDIVDAYSSGNRNDMQRSLTRGLTKSGLMGAGAAIGSFIPGVGTLFGAGAGALIGQLWGDDIADSISGIHKSAEELKQDRLDELFGDIAMSASDLGKVAQNMVGSWQTQVSQAHQQALTTGYSLQDTTNSSYFGVVESGSKLDNSYMDNIEEQMNQEMYNAFMVNDDLFGYGQWDTTTLSDKWKNAFETFAKQKKELGKYLEIALSDGNFSPDERDYVFGTIHSMQQSSSELAPDEGQTKADTYSYLAQNGMLSKDSYDSVIKDIQTEYTKDMFNLAEKRSVAIANGQNPNEANNIFWSSANDRTESHLQTLLDNAQDMFGSDYNSVLSDVWNGKVDAFGHNAGLSSQLNDNNSAYQKALKKSMESSELSKNTVDIQDATQQTLYSRQYLSNAQKSLSTSFELGDSASKEVVKEAYTGMQPALEQAEKQYQSAKENGQNPNQYLDEMMGMYQMGAMGGDKTAQGKYEAMLMSGNAESAKAINDAFGTDYNLMKQYMGDDFANMWQLLNGGNTESAIEQTTEAAKNALEKNAKNTVDAIKDNKDQKIDAMNETDEKAAQAVEDSTKEQEALESKTDGTEQSKEDTKSTELPDDLGENVLDAVSSSIENIKDGKLKDLELGKTVMDSISESLSTDNMDFKELGFGESLMGAISESLSTDNLDFKELGFGESLMSAISESLSVDNMDFGKLGFGESLMSAISTSLSADNMDFSQISIGESVMNGISSSLAETDFSGLDIGTKITDTINASMGESVELHPNFTVVPGTVDTSSLSSAINDSISTITENNSELSVLAKVDGTANYELGTYPKEVPKITGTAKYTGIFPTVAPKIYGTVEYRTTFGHFAHGTRNAPEGLAYLNDDGSADPRELVEHNGQFLMYEGRNVLAPLSAGDRVFTSSETKDILSGRGIPHYATGLNNDVIENEKIQGGGSTSGANVHFESGSMSIMFNIDGSKDGNVVEQIKAHAPEIAQLISDEIDRHLTASFANSGGNNE